MYISKNTHTKRCLIFVWSYCRLRKEQAAPLNEYVCITKILTVKWKTLVANALQCNQNYHQWKSTHTKDFASNVLIAESRSSKVENPKCSPVSSKMQPLCVALYWTGGVGGGFCGPWLSFPGGGFPCCERLNEAGRKKNNAKAITIHMVMIMSIVLPPPNNPLTPSWFGESWMHSLSVQ